MTTAEQAEVALRVIEAHETVEHVSTRADGPILLARIESVLGGPLNEEGWRALYRLADKAFGRSWNLTISTRVAFFEREQAVTERAAHDLALQNSLGALRSPQDQGSEGERK